MFFRRKTVHIPTFEERIGNLVKFDFVTTPEPGVGVRATRGGFGALLKDLGNGKVGLTKAGLIVGKEVAEVVHGGYQMFFQTPSGKVLPALAEQLIKLHAFDEDIREGLGLTSLYNLSLGTIAEAHMYDRVEDRDHPHGPRPWEKKAQAHS